MNHKGFFKLQTVNKYEVVTGIACKTERQQWNLAKEIFFPVPKGFVDLTVTR